MQIYLAGYNIDTEVLKEYEKLSGKKLISATPETISASYARISRDPRPVNQLRETARKEVEKARKSNRNIIFNMGHQSIAEHAVFNFDIIGVSRLAIEEIERCRLCSFTEKSQRYITLTDDYVIPDEIKKTALEKEYQEIIQRQNELYHKMFKKLKDYIFKKYPELSSNEKKHNMLEGWAKEDARYISSLATKGQLGMTINGRSLEYMIRRFASHPLSEIRNIGKKMYELVKDTAPSIIKYTKSNDYDEKTPLELKEMFKHFLPKQNKKKEVVLIDWTQKGDKKLIASIIHHYSNLSYEECLEKTEEMSQKELEKIIKTTFKHMEFFNSVQREFEIIYFFYELIVSASCFAQLKRHRMATIIPQDYDIELGATIPASVKDTGFEKEFQHILEITHSFYKKLKEFNPYTAPYILTNANRRKVLIKLNARELYHISRLREDPHAQWDIRNISTQMVAKAKEKAPIAMMLACSKKDYPERYKEIFGKYPSFNKQ